MKRNKGLLIAAAGILVLAAVILIVVMMSSGKPMRIDPLSTTDQPVSSEALTDVPTETIEDVTEETGPSYPTVELDVPPIVKQDTTLLIEAEDVAYTGMLMVESLRAGFSGEGYLAGFACNEGDSAKAVFSVPSAQHYDITISVCADTAVTNALMLNGEEIGQFSIEETGNFVRVTFSGIYLPKGEAELSIREIDGQFVLDYFEISDYTEMYQMEYKDEYELSDADASEGAQALMAFLSENYGEKVITGQYAATDGNTETDLIFHLTGKYPAIRFGDLEGYTQNSAASEHDAIQASMDWAAKGGIVGLMWHWDAPMGVSSVYAEETEFSLKAAMTEEDIALLDQEDIDKLYEEEVISEECCALLRDIDSISATLQPLAEADIPVLWRPLHEASGDWFWWGSDGAEAYRWLWELLYTRMTEYHALHNLIWIWNGQSESYLVDEDMYDIASLDIYLSEDADYSSRYEQYVLLSRMTGGKKLLALSETSSVPDMNDMFRDNCIWSFFGLWYGEYLIDEEGKYSEKYTSAEDMIALYNSEAVITRSDVKAYFASPEETETTEATEE